MAERIDYFFTVTSPWAYLGHDAFLTLADRHRAQIAYRPIPIGPVFAASGAVPLAQRPAIRQRYRLIELQRWRARRGLPLNLKPAFHPADASLADCAAIAIAQRGGDPGAYLSRAFRAVWAEERNIADEGVVGDLLEASGEAADAIVAAAGSEAVREIYRANGEAATATGGVGSPVYVRRGEPFWGQDRLDFLDEALASGRAPFTAA